MPYEWLDAYLLEKPSVTKDYKAEWGWFRYMIGGKLFAAICMGSDGNDLLTLKLSPPEGEFLRAQYKDVIPGYYMNKVHWNSIRLNGVVERSLIFELIDKSYALIRKALPKKLRDTL